MKKIIKIFKLIMILPGLFLSLPVNSQDDVPSKFTTGIDLYSSYVWRVTSGSRFHSPKVSFKIYG